MKTILLNLPMPITTPRLLLRPPQIGDGVAVNAAILESYDLLRRSMEWLKEKPTINETEELVRLCAANWIIKKNKDPWLQFYIFKKKTNQFVGCASYQNIRWEIPSFETGYWVRSSCAKQGLMLEAINSLTQYAFKQLKAKRHAILCDIKNIASRKVPERLGFQLEAILKAHRLNLANGKISDTLIYTRHDLSDLPELDVKWPT